MKPGEIRELSDEELMKKERDTKEELFNLRVQIATNQTTNVARVRKLRKDLARVLTLKRERELGIRRK
ncbi:MAG TPA: 50S ribosomal protein L29 [Thermodesulfobacteriota bacterium]|jgi:large subunit ribosomal protein L29|nr:50S ribosomal protein L29 [Thermodesulfobacteriota bacterium]